MKHPTPAPELNTLISILAAIVVRECVKKEGKEGKEGSKAA